MLQKTVEEKTRPEEAPGESGRREGEVLVFEMSPLFSRVTLVHSAVTSQVLVGGSHSYTSPKCKVIFTFQISLRSVIVDVC